MRFAKCLLILLSFSGMALAQEFKLKVDVSLISLDVGVYDRKGDAITTLGKEDFLVFEDGEPQAIQAFEPGAAAFNALLVVDQSGSMREAWDSVVAGLNRFMGVLQPRDRVAIAAFDSGIDMVTNWRSAHSERREKIGMTPGGMGTDFYGAIVWAAGYIRGEKGRKGVIVFTDGQQSRGGTADFPEALEKARRSNIPFYFIGYSTTPQSAAEMKQLAEASGGRAFFPKSASELVGIYEQIGRDLGRAYTISYSPRKAPDGRFRKIEVRPIDVRLHVAQSRDGYYAR